MVEQKHMEKPSLTFTSPKTKEKYLKIGKHQQNTII